MYQTKEDYRAAWAGAYLEDPPVPLNVDLELASVCNLSCPFCFIPDPAFDAHIRTKAADGKTRARMMPTEMAIRLIEQCAALGVPALKMNWRGESTLHPDYHEILAYAARIPKPDDWRCSCHLFGAHPAFFEVLVNTNANCSESAVNGLMCATKVMVSLDSLVPATYAVMRRGGSLEKAKAVIKELIRRKHPNIWVRRVLAKENSEELFRAMVADEFGEHEFLHVSQHYCFDRNAASRHEAPGCDHDASGPARTYCGYPSQRLVVASTGLVYPCCIDLHEEMPVGDVTKQSIKEIWESEAMQKLRVELRQSTFRSAACQTCQSWMSHSAPQRAYVQDVEVQA